MISEALVFLLSAGVAFVIPTAIFQYRHRKTNELTSIITERKNTIIKQVNAILERQQEYDSFISNNPANPFDI